MSSSFALCFGALPCVAQSGKAELFGTILDPSALPIAYANVRLEEQATNTLFQAISGEHGDYHFLGLPVGQYILVVDHPEFRTYRQSGITLRISDQVLLDVQLEVGDQHRLSKSVSKHLTGNRIWLGELRRRQKNIVTLPLDG